MGSFQRNAWWLITFLLGLSTQVIGAPAQISSPDRLGPAKGGFKWTQFKGKYDFSECLSRPSAIWGDGPPGAFVQIDHKVTYTRGSTTEGLELMRASNLNPIAMGWSVERVDQGRQTENVTETGKVGKIMESYATADGVYGMMAWHRPHNVGWSTLQLRMDAQGKISLTIRQRTGSDASTREETCTLRKFGPNFNT